MQIEPRIGYRAVVRRVGQRWWASVRTRQGSWVDLDLQNQAEERLVDPAVVPTGLPTELANLLSKATRMEAPHETGQVVPSAVQGEQTDWPATLLKLCWPDFLVHQGCVFRAESVEQLPNLAQFEDRTAAEAFVNHVHVEDAFRDEVGRLQYELSTEQCYQIARMWMYKLKAEFPRRHFLLYLFIEGEGAHLRFHTYRPNEPMWTDPTLLFDEAPEQSAVWFI